MTNTLNAVTVVLISRHRKCTGWVGSAQSQQVMSSYISLAPQMSIKRRGLSTIITLRKVGPEPIPGFEAGIHPGWDISTVML